MLLLRKGLADNIVIFPQNDYDASSFTYANGNYSFTHKALGADMFRYSWNFAQNWSQWQNWEDVTSIQGDVFDGNFWEGQHIIVQCKLMVNHNYGIN